MESTENMKVEEITEPTSAGTPDGQPIPDVPPATGESKQEIPITRIHECSDGKQRNDEQYEQWKKEQEALELKKAQFKKDPSLFCHVDDIVMAVVQGPHGRAIVFGHYSIEETKCALVTLQHRFFNALTEFEYKMEMKAKEKALVGADGKSIGAPKPGGIIT